MAFRFGHKDGETKAHPSNMANKTKYEKYKQNKTREKNKIKKIFKHLKRHFNDLSSGKKLEELKALVK